MARIRFNRELVVCAVLFAVEFVVDKIPLADTGWDVLHTLVRPTVAGWLGATLAGAVEEDDRRLRGIEGGAAGGGRHAAAVDGEVHCSALRRGAQRLAQCAGAALVHDGDGVREELLMRRAIDAATKRGKELGKG